MHLSGVCRVFIVSGRLSWCWILVVLFSYHVVSAGVCFSSELLALSSSYGFTKSLGALHVYISTLLLLCSPCYRFFALFKGVLLWSLNLGVNFI